MSDDAPDKLITAIQKRLKKLAGLLFEPKRELVGQLLAYRRILLILDDLTETIGSWQVWADRQHLKYPINALIVTTRSDGICQGEQSVTLEPILLKDAILTRLFGAI